MKRTLARAIAGAATLALAACVSVDFGGDPPPAQGHWSLQDARSSGVTRRAETLVPALLIQPQTGLAMTDTVSIAYSRRENEFAFYQFASWTERPMRQLPRLLQRRLEARGVAAAVGLLGDPLRADWLLVIRIDALHHDVRSPPGEARLALSAELFDRRNHARIAQRRFEASAASERADSAAAVQALSQTVASSFDQLVPWLESELQRAASAPR